MYLEQFSFANIFRSIWNIFFANIVCSVWNFFVSLSSLNFRDSDENEYVHPREIFDLPYKGLECQIPSSSSKMVEFWKILLQALSHPLWFPMLCLAFTPILAFILIKWEVEGDTSRLQSSKIIVILLFVYFAIFFFDLVQFATDSGENASIFTHIRRLNVIDENDLIVTYVFHHWSRPLAALIRNLMCFQNIIHSFKRPSVTILKT